MNKILITGSAGFIGSIVSQYLINKGFYIFGVDNLSTGQNLIYSKNYKFVKGDFSSQKIINLIKKNSIDSVIHLAASIDNAESVKKPNKYIENNYTKSVKFYKKCELNNIQNFIFSSSAAVYGKVMGKKKLSEKSNTKPITPYGRSKLMFEKFLKEKNTKQIKITILRFFNIAGTSFDYKFSQSFKSYNHIFKKLTELELIKKKKYDFIINGRDYLTKDKTCVRDYVHAQDIAKIFFLILRDKKKRKLVEVFNCCTGKAVSVLQIVKLFTKYSRKKIQYSFGPRRPGDPPFLVGNNKKITNRFKFRFNTYHKICKDIFKYINEKKS